MMTVITHSSDVTSSSNDLNTINTINNNTDKKEKKNNTDEECPRPGVSNYNNNINNNSDNDDVLREASTSIPDSNSNDDNNNNTIPLPFWTRIYNNIISILYDNMFTLMILCAIGFAKAYPILGAVYLYPDITSSWIAVALIFCLVGCGLKLNELTHAIGRFRFNTFVQVYDILFISIIVFSVSRALVALDWLDIELANGMVVCGCLPMSVNAVIIMTSTANGDEGAAVFNTALGNFLGVFVSPPLVVLYLQSSESDVNLADVLLKLTLKVIVPFIVGQLAQRYICYVQEFYYNNKTVFKKIQELLLAYIVYTVFCKTFQNGTKTQIQHIFIVIIVQLVLMILLMCFAWKLLQKLFPNQYKLHVMGIFGCTQKTIALGVPLIQSMYGTSQYLAMFTLPILIWHPMQLVVGSIVSPWLRKYIESETIRLALLENNNTTNNNNNQCTNSHHSHSNNNNNNNNSNTNNSRHNNNNNNNNNDYNITITNGTNVSSTDSGDIEINSQTSDPETCNATDRDIRTKDATTVSTGTSAPTTADPIIEQDITTTTTTTSVVQGP